MEPAGEDFFDVVVVGAGVAGTSAAIVLRRDGYKVALIDAKAVYPRDFRAEKIGATQLEPFDKLGLGDAVRAMTTPMDDNWVFRFGHLVSRVREREYGFAYDGLVNGLRALLPPDCLVPGRVARVETSADRQSVHLSDGRRFDGRLLVVATGLGDAVRRMVNVRKVEISRCHSLSLGFDLSRPTSTYRFETLNYYGVDPQDRIAFLTLFPIAEIMRANLFVYREVAEDWTTRFRRAPSEMLKALMPGLDRACDGFEVVGPVEARPIDLTKVEGHRQPGVVLVGDAFNTGCPIPGVGIRRAMIDVERLCSAHIPVWMKTPGMGVEKIDAFYDDAEKVASDARSMRTSLYSRQMTVGTSPVWVARRQRNALIRRGLYFGRRLAGSLRPAARQA